MVSNKHARDLEEILAKRHDDGRVRVAPKTTIYPCHTAIAAAALCRTGFARDRRVKAMLDWLLDNRHDDGGWRCNRSSKGGPQTKRSNPGVTLFAVDAFRAAGRAGEVALAAFEQPDRLTMGRRDSTSRRQPLSLRKTSVAKNATRLFPVPVDERVDHQQRFEKGRSHLGEIPVLIRPRPVQRALEQTRVAETGWAPKRSMRSKCISLRVCQ